MLFGVVPGLFAFEWMLIFRQVAMPQALRVAVCQVPEIREDAETALSWVSSYAERATGEGASLVCFPECFLQGYLVEEKAARRHALDVNSAAFASVLERLRGIVPMLVVGMIEVDEGALYNTAAIIESGRLVGRYRKVNLLTGERLFRSGVGCPVFTKGAVTFGINICSDTRRPDLAAAVARQGARIIVCPANNMMRRDRAAKWKHLHNEARACRARETGCWLISADVTGERDDSIALGPTAIINPAGRVVAQVPLLEAGMVTAEVE